MCVHAHGRRPWRDLHYIATRRLQAFEAIFAQRRRQAPAPAVSDACGAFLCSSLSVLRSSSLSSFAASSLAALHALQPQNALLVAGPLFPRFFSPSRTRLWCAPCGTPTCCLTLAPMIKRPGSDNETRQQILKGAVFEANLENLGIFCSPQIPTSSRTFHSTTYLNNHTPLRYPGTLQVK